MARSIGYREEGYLGRENQRWHQLTYERDGLLGFKFGGKMSQEQIDKKASEYKEAGWTHVESVGRLAFASEDGRWWHTWDCETGRAMFIDAEWIKNLNMRKSDEYKGEEHGTV